MTRLTNSQTQLFRDLSKAAVGQNFSSIASAELSFDANPKPALSDDVNYIGGTLGADILVGTSLNDSITAYDGDDLLYGNDGKDSLSGGPLLASRSPGQAR